MKHFEPKRPYQEVGLVLRNQLKDGHYQIGERLPPEREIAEKLGVSRTVVREALIMLELENLIEVRKGSGVYVVQLPKANSVPQDTSNMVGPFEMLQARQLLESNIAEFAALQATPNDIVKMRQALELQQQGLEGQNTGEEENGDREFHLAIAEATHNSVLVEFFRQIWHMRENPMWHQLHVRITDTAYRKEWYRDHRAILAAMTKKDPVGAKQAMWQHLENVKQRLMELSDIDDPNFDGYLFQSYPIDHGNGKNELPRVPINSD